MAPKTTGETRRSAASPAAGDAADGFAAELAGDQVTITTAIGTVRELAGELLWIPESGNPTLMRLWETLNALLEQEDGTP